MSVLDKIWEQVEASVFVSRAEFLRGLDGWDVREVEVNGRVAGAILTRGPEFHFATFGETTRITARMARELLQPIIDQYGYVDTRTPKDAIRQQRFNLLIGFEAWGEDEFFIHYRAHKLRLDWRDRCQS